MRGLAQWIARAFANSTVRRHVFLGVQADDENVNSINLADRKGGNRNCCIALPRVNKSTKRQRYACACNRRKIQNKNCCVSFGIAFGFSLDIYRTYCCGCRGPFPFFSGFLGLDVIFDDVQALQ